jgi:hypothetical protein
MTVVFWNPNEQMPSHLSPKDGNSSVAKILCCLLKTRQTNFEHRAIQSTTLRQYPNSEEAAVYFVNYWKQHHN